MIEIPANAEHGTLTTSAAERIGAGPGPVRYVLADGCPPVSRHVWTPDGTRIAGFVEIGPTGIVPVKPYSPQTCTPDTPAHG